MSEPSPTGQTLWHGRFEGSPSEALQALNDSLPFDQRMYRQDIEGSRAHVSMLAAVGLVTEAERDAILGALDQVEAEISTGAFAWAPADEDIHTAVERRVTELAPAGAKLHTGRSRNDQVATDLRLWVKDELGDLAQLV
ncbi:MAG: lyase family protein, partial [Acidimicrobiales bacterium]